MDKSGRSGAIGTPKPKAKPSRKGAAAGVVATEPRKAKPLAGVTFPVARDSFDWEFSSIGSTVLDYLEELAAIRADSTSTGDFSDDAKMCEQAAASAQRHWLRGDDLAARVEFEMVLRAYGAVCALSGGEVAAKARSANSSKAGKKRAANHATAVVKPKVFALWEERENGKHPRLLRSNRFALEVLRRWPDQVAYRTVLEWCKEWRQAARERRK